MMKLSWLPKENNKPPLLSQIFISPAMKKLMFNILKGTKTRVGLDIGNYSLKVAQIEENDGSFKLLNAAMKDIRQEKNIPQAISELFKQNKISNRQVNLSVSGDSVVARYLSLPKMTENELKDAMQFELEDHIPFKPDEVYTDYHVLGDEPNSKNRMRVFLVAAKKDLVDEKLKLIRQAGLEPRLITTDAFAMKNTFYFNHPDKAQANVTLLNIGDKVTNLLISKDNVPYFIRDTRFGGEAITALIQSKSQMERTSAEELKHNLKTANPDISDIVKATLGNLLNEIFVSIDFYENLTEQRIDEIYLTGGSSQIEGLKSFLEGYLNLPILSLEPFKGFSSSAAPKADLDKLSVYFAVAIGLALEKA
jgi:type IV pilus assembly protein PilM